MKKQKKPARKVVKKPVVRKAAPRKKTTPRRRGAVPTLPTVTSTAEQPLAPGSNGLETPQAQPVPEVRREGAVRFRPNRPNLVDSVAMTVTVKDRVALEQYIDPLRVVRVVDSGGGPDLRTGWPQTFLVYARHRDATGGPGIVVGMTDGAI